TERHRGLDHEETLVSPGYFSAVLTKDRPLVFFTTAEPHGDAEISFDQLAEAETKRLTRLIENAPEILRKGMAARLLVASDQFIVLPETRVRENVKIEISGEHVRSVIAGYHWFTDWGRDTMISLEGLCLCTNRFEQAKAILRTFANYVQKGLLPNHFPEG